MKWQKKQLINFFYFVFVVSIFTTLLKPQDIDKQEEIKNKSSLTIHNSKAKNDLVYQEIKKEIKTLEPFAFLGLIRITSKAAPHFYSFIKTIADEMSMPTPPFIFVCKDKFSYFFNVEYSAMASSLIQNVSAVLIDIDLVHMLPLEELEGVIAHELAHIKHYHMPKAIISGLSFWVILYYLFHRCLGNNYISPFILEFLIKTVGTGFHKNFDYKKIYDKEKGIIFSFTGKKDDKKYLDATIFLWKLIYELIVGLSIGLAVYAFRCFLSRHFEKQADLTAVQFTKNPQKLADALKCFGEEPAQLWGIFETHPTLAERIDYLEKAAVGCVNAQ